MAWPLLLTGLFSSGYVANDLANWWNNDDGTPIDNLKHKQTNPGVYLTVGAVAAVAGLIVYSKVKK